MYSDISPTKPEAMYFTNAVNSCVTSSLGRAKIIAMAVGLAIAKSLPPITGAQVGDLESFYEQTHSGCARDWAGAVNELTPLDTKMARQYASRFYQTIHGACCVPLNEYSASTSSGVAHALLGTATRFSAEDLAFMECECKSVLKIAAAAIPLFKLQD